jgi:hypothetical protein
LTKKRLTTKPYIKIVSRTNEPYIVKSQTHTFKSQIQNRLGFPNRNFKSQNSVSFQIAKLCFLGFSNHSIKLGVLGFHLRITTSIAFSQNNNWTDGSRCSRCFNFEPKQQSEIFPWFISHVYLFICLLFAWFICLWFWKKCAAYW